MRYFQNVNSYPISLTRPHRGGTVTLRVGEFVEGEWFSKYAFLKEYANLPDPGPGKKKLVVVYSQTEYENNRIPVSRVHPLISAPVVSGLDDSGNDGNEPGEKSFVPSVVVDPNANNSSGGSLNDESDSDNPDQDGEGLGDDEKTEEEVGAGEDEGQGSDPVTPPAKTEEVVAPKVNKFAPKNKKPSGKK